MRSDICWAMAEDDYIYPFGIDSTRRDLVEDWVQSATFERDWGDTGEYDAPWEVSWQPAHTDLGKLQRRAWRNLRKRRPGLRPIKVRLVPVGDDDE